MIVNKYKNGGGGSGSGSTYTAGEYISISEDVISVTGITPSEYLTTADTQDLASKAYVTGITNPIQTQVDDIERVTATALTELHDAILELSGDTPDLSNYYTKAQVDAEITGATQGTYTTGNTFTKTGRYNQKNFYYLDPLGYDAPEFYAPTTSGIPGQVLIAASGTSVDGTSNTPVWTNLATINGSGLTNGGNIVIGVPQDFMDSTDAEVISTALNDLDSRIDTLSGSTSGYATHAEVTAATSNYYNLTHREITAATQDMATQAYVTGITSPMQTAINGKVGSDGSVDNIVKISQADYDDLVTGGTVDTYTFYIITGSTGN